MFFLLLPGERISYNSAGLVARTDYQINDIPLFEDAWQYNSSTPVNYFQFYGELLIPAS